MLSSKENILEERSLLPSTKNYTSWPTVNNLDGDKTAIISLSHQTENRPVQLPEANAVNIMTRDCWSARETRKTDHMVTPVNFVFIHHTAMSRCYNHHDSCEEMKRIQDLHMDGRGWDDIAYNFVISEEGQVYEGRGWDRVGAHTKSWNDVAIAICIMGNFVDKEPDSAAKSTLKNLLEFGVRLGKISADYTLHGHRDVRDTACPGDKLYNFIKSLSHFDQNKPHNPKYPNQNLPV
ncbi:hypothetical protein ScPMuIL_005617 [Solemya velum]